MRWLGECCISKTKATGGPASRGGIPTNRFLRTTPSPIRARLTDPETCRIILIIRTNPGIRHCAARPLLTILAKKERQKQFCFFYAFVA